jgi:hypothetical protein
VTRLNLDVQQQIDWLDWPQRWDAQQDLDRLPGQGCVTSHAAKAA